VTDRGRDHAPSLECILKVRQDQPAIEKTDPEKYSTPIVLPDWKHRRMRMGLEFDPRTDHEILCEVAIRVTVEGKRIGAYDQSSVPRDDRPTG
jgi:hypothetical protein